MNSNNKDKNKEQKTNALRMMWTMITKLWTAVINGDDSALMIHIVLYGQEVNDNDDDNNNYVDHIYSSNLDFRQLLMLIIL